MSKTAWRATAFVMRAAAYYLLCAAFFVSPISFAFSIFAALLFTVAKEPL